LLTTRSLYFACPSELNDPYEGSFTRSEAKALSEMVQRTADGMLALRPHFAIKSANSLAVFDQTMRSFQQKVRESAGMTARRFGVCCWHMSDYESDAMWKLYTASGQGVAIESTVSNLRASLGGRQDIQIDAVRYVDFDKDPIEKGHRHYFLFQKRKSFEHEREMRATIPLPKEGIGTLVPCDLDVLVNQVHVSPLVAGYVKDAVEGLCYGAARPLRKPVLQRSFCLPRTTG